MGFPVFIPLKQVCEDNTIMWHIRLCNWAVLASIPAPSFETWDEIQMKSIQQDHQYELAVCIMQMKELIGPAGKSVWDESKKNT